MKDVYKVYGKDYGTINNVAADFFEKAIAFCEKYSDDNEIIKIGDVGASLLFYEMKLELEKLQNAIKNYCTDRREAFQEIANQERADYNDYQQHLGDWSSDA